MKKIIKIALIACMLFGTGLISVSAASYTSRGQVVETGSTTELATGGLKIELLAGDYTAGAYEVGAHAGIFTSNDITASQDTKPWYHLASFNLSSSEVATLKSTSIYKEVTGLNFDFGVSNLQVKVGTGNYNKYTGSALTDPTKPTDPSTGGSIQGILSAAQLAPYSNLSMNVYPSSRVTSVKQNGSNIVVEGYMFESNADCIYSDTRNWREIVFVNEANPSTAYAYRKLVTPIYNTWLNSNATATVNGRYKLNYANYKVSFNPNSVTNYAKQPAKMQPGSYLVYMRISNGKTSNLFPLMDKTLNNGTNMENTGTLPNGFEVVEQTDRTLRYVVK